MNKIKATIQAIETMEGITKIVSTFDKNSIKAITLELPQDIKVSDELFFIFKETEVGIAKHLSGEVSFSNAFKGDVVELEIGKILSKVVVLVNGEKIGSIITTDAIKRLSLQTGDTVTAFVKATEVGVEVLL